MSDYPDREHSRVVLIGTSDYERSENLPNLTAIQNNLSGLKWCLADSDFAVFAPEHCTVIDNPDTPRSMLSRLRRDAAQAGDVLLVYYAGHGVLDRRGELHLAVRQMESDPYEVDGTAVPVNSVKQIIEDSPARARVLIVDCCFSGMAIGVMSPDSAAMDQIDARGTYILTSTQANRISNAFPGERYSAFTGQVIRLLTDGSQSVDAPLTLGELSQRLHRAMAANGLPRPMSRAHDTSDGLILRKPRTARPVPSGIDERINAAMTRAKVENHDYGNHPAAIEKQVLQERRVRALTVRIVILTVLSAGVFLLGSILKTFGPGTIAAIFILIPVLWNGFLLVREKRNFGSSASELGAHRRP